MALDIKSIVSGDLGSPCRADFGWTADQIIQRYVTSEEIGRFAKDHLQNMEKIKSLTQKLSMLGGVKFLVDPGDRYNQILLDRKILEIKRILPGRSLSPIERDYEKLRLQITRAMEMAIASEESLKGHEKISALPKATSDKCLIEEEEIGIVRGVVRAIIGSVG